ncbi:pilus assembly protein [Pseudomonas sp. SCB32]|uniref:pilus assembly protein n=1 Tax=Pseudomonas sp. SCB32 TaxID=2653853 RepID=UPI001264E546|nr:PilC/PilY family type IV pilus protein [Pseudomonas sp. SCB32]
MLKKLATPGKLGVWCSSFLSFSILFTQAVDVQAAVSQTPMLLGSSNVPGSLALVPSVEWPTILSIANLGAYSSAKKYTGYFDPGKCYQYRYDSSKQLYNYSKSTALNNTDAQKVIDTYFYPVGNAASYKCNVSSAKKEWSGNFLNWVGTPTIDPFRSALTGGNRIQDTTNLTVLQKARHDGQSSAGNRMTSGQGMLPKSEIAGATPLGSDWGAVYIRLQGLYYDMMFSSVNTAIGGSDSSSSGKGEIVAQWVDYDENNSDQWTSNRLKSTYTSSKQTKNVYRLRVQVKVCDSSMLESNCKRYASNYKPEGLLQQYSNTLRYSAFSYLNDSSVNRDGGILRANQKYIGPTLGDGGTNNSQTEWDPSTGIFASNPNPADATSTGSGIAQSGVINYINKFGSMTDKAHKSLDPVSELYYTAIRYYKNQGNVSAYSNVTSDNYNTFDGFPVVTQWTDPITYACQKNVILGIGDVNTHNDKNLPGNTNATSEPTKPQEVSTDTTVDVVQATNKVASLEGVDLKASSSSFTGRNNSAYIAGLAYDSHTKDMRSDIGGKQTVSTYWADVQENQNLAGRASNQYWLAAKYGGFKVPTNFDPYSSTASLTDDLWWTNGETLSTGDKRPDNFFVASDAEKMVTSLKTAFANIVQEVRSSTTSLATNSTQLDTGSAIYQSQYNSEHWSGDLQAKSVNGNGVVATTPNWSAAARLDALTDLSARKIFTANTLAGQAGNTYFTTTSGVDFTWSTLDADTKVALRRTADATTSVSEAEAQNRLAFLRGDRSREVSTSNPTNPYRERSSRLGDIVNSDPQYVANQDFGYNLLTGSQWGNAGPAYLTYRASSSYKSKKPLVVLGANDGMLHGFDGTLSNGGAELFAYVPRTIADSLYQLTQPEYSHRYYVDGSPAFSDAYIGSSWKTIVVGTTGAGGKSVFALDVTAPSNMTSGKVLWEFTAPEMGNPMQRPAIVALANGKFGVVVTSGFVNNAVSSGKVWILDAADGSVIKQFTITTTGGLADPLAIDINNDRVADRIYVGDTVGNLWRLDITGTDPSNWGAPSSLNGGALFQARDSSNRVQPITAPLAAALNTDGKPMVLFGTGSFYQTIDTDLQQNQRIESFYGVIDAGTTVTRDDLLEQKILGQQTIGDNRLRVVSNNAMTTATKGWYLDLLWKQAQGGSNTLTGERVVSRPILRGGGITFTSLTPSDDPCTGGGVSWIMALDALGNGRLPYNYFDANGDGVISDQDFYVDSAGNKIPYSGISDSTDGVIKTPSFFSKEDGDDLICYVGSKGGEPQCAPVPPGNRTSGRLSWREVNR